MVVAEKFKELRSNLASLDNQPVGKAVLVVILLLDLFILQSIFRGLSDHTRQLESPYQLIPAYCRDVVLKRAWDETNRLQRVAQTVNSYHSANYREYGADTEMNPLCTPFDAALKSISADAQLRGKLNDYLQLRDQIRTQQAEFDQTKGSYDTSLFEKIAGEDEQADTANATGIKANAAALQRRALDLRAAINASVAGQ